MRYRIALIPVLLMLGQVAFAADPGLLQLPDLSALAKKASHSVVISLDPSMLGIAGSLLQDDSDADVAAVKNVVQGLRGVYVRSFTFDHDGAYSSSDVDAVRSQLAAPGWQPLVASHDREHDSTVDVYIRHDGKVTQGMVIIAAQPRQLTIVNLVGPIDLAQLARLQGRLGVPRLDLSH
jgi:hypothetical protein